MRKTTQLGALAALLFLSTGAEAANVEDQVLRQAVGNAYWVYVSSSDSKSMELWYIGTATESVVTIGSVSLRAFAPAGTLDTAVDTDGVIDLSAADYDTMGELCDYLDGLTNYGCKLLGGKRNDNTNRLRDQTATSGTNDLKARGGFEVRFDTAPINGGGFTDTAFDLRVWATPAGPNKSIVLKFCDVNVNVADNFRVFGKSIQSSLKDTSQSRTLATEDTSTLVFSEVVADDTAETFDFTDRSNGVGWKFAPGTDVVVSGGNGTGIQAGANYVRCLFQEL